MNVRSITLFSPRRPPSPDEMATLGAHARAARTALEEDGLSVQTTRLALPPWPGWSGGQSPRAAMRRLEGALDEIGFDYLSCGPVPLDISDRATRIAEVEGYLAESERLFFAVEIARTGWGIDVAGARLTADLIHRAATLEADGFANLRLAALCNVDPGGPFFPAAYADPTLERPALALALESADLAVEAYADADTLEEAGARLQAALERLGSRLEELLAPLCRERGVVFLGLDFSLAPFPSPERSVAGAIESLGASPFGTPGTLVAAATTTQALRDAAYRSCGFSGLMLPVLEDGVLAARSGEGSFDLTSLLLYSATCGTGLDTVPLAGDVPVDALHALLLDVAALSISLNKPLTARLMPVPGARAGEPTRFDFPYFAPGTILDLPAPRGGAILRGDRLALRPRHL